MNASSKPPPSGADLPVAKAEKQPRKVTARPPKTRAIPLMIPIRELGPKHRKIIREHLLSLPARDRYLRFGFPATDMQIQQYAKDLNFTHDDVFGILNRQLELIAVAHLGYSENKTSKTAEFGVSVLNTYRGQGLGARMYERAVLHARNAGMDMLYIHALSENTPMLKIARKAGSTIHRDGSESEGFLKLPPPNFNTHMSESIDEHYAAFDYQLKVQANYVQDMFHSFKRWQKSLTGEKKQAKPQDADNSAPAAEKDPGT